MPGPGWFRIDDSELVLVTDVLTTKEISRYRFGGTLDAPSKVYTFEREFARIFACPYCIGMNSATSALLSALVASDVGPGDEVIVPGYTFIATIAAVIHAGAIPVLGEINETLTLDPRDVARKITPRTRAILPVHMLGRPCDMAALTALAERHELLVIEDAAQACGGSFAGRRLGTWGDAGAFSLNGTKVITGGDGGVLLTSSEELYRRAFAFHDHGSAPLRLGVTDHGPHLGLNFRMPELVGAMALAQLHKLDTILDTLRVKHAMLADALGEIPGVCLAPSNDLAGDCTTTLAMTFELPERAQQVASALGTITLDVSPRHVYWRMPQLRPRIVRARNRRVSNTEPFQVLPGTTRGALPRTDDLLSRSIALSVGVVDGYLGTGYGITIEATETEIRQIAHEVRSTIESLP